MKTFKKVPIEQEPKRNNRFFAELPEEFKIESYLIQSISKPKIVNGEWQNIEITFLDLCEKISTSHNVRNMIEICNIRKSHQSFLERIFCMPLFEMSLKSLDPTGVEVENWTISIGKIVSVDFGDLDYGDDDLQKVKMVLRPTKCKLEN